VRRQIVAVAAALALGGCQDAPKEAPKAAAPPRPLVVASFYPLYDFARQIAGDRAEVISLVPAGVEPHDWEPSPRDVARVEKARVFVYNGAGFDAGAECLAKNAAPGTVVVEATAGLPLVAVDLPGHDKGHDGKAQAKAEAQRDPHVWLDPTLARLQVEAIRAGLAKADPANAEHYASRSAAYATRLTKLHEAMATGLGDCRRREIVVSHAAFTYLAQRYKLLQVPAMGVSPEAEPSPAELARIVRQIRRLKATVVFFETLVSPKLAETLAAEVGAKTMVLNPLEGLTADEEKAGKDYVGVMEENLRNLRVALECR
jgi:zinc transport system substrate-binding protein